MTKLERILRIRDYLWEKGETEPKRMYEELGFEKEISYPRFKRLLDTYDPSLSSWPNKPYNRELFILSYLKDHTDPERPYVVSAQKLIYAMDLIDQVSVRSIERYIEELKKAGFPILTKRGIEGGYKIGKRPL